MRRIRDKIEKNKSRWFLSLCLMSICMAAVFFAGCASLGGDTTSPYAGKQTADLSGYESMSDLDDESRLVDTTVKDIAKYMDEKKTFAFFVGYEDCDYCNALLPYLNEAARGEDIYVGYLNTRANPQWKNNTDIDDYDTFVELFGDYLKKENDKPILYTPDLYFIKAGEVVGHHQGLIEGAEDPESALDSDQETALRTLLEGYMAELK